MSVSEWLGLKAVALVLVLFLALMSGMTKAMLGRWWPPPGWDEM